LPVDAKAKVKGKKVAVKRTKTVKVKPAKGKIARKKK